MARVAVMYLGRIVEVEPSARLFAEARHPYTRALLDSVLTPEPELGVPDTHLGAVYPNAVDPPLGCTFHPCCARGRLGFNAKFMIEIGEENGSRGLEELVVAHREEFAADVFIASDGSRVDRGRANLTLGNRGAFNVVLECKLRDAGHLFGDWGGVLAFATGDPARPARRGLADPVPPGARCLGALPRKRPRPPRRAARARRHPRARPRAQGLPAPRRAPEFDFRSRTRFENRLS